MTNIDYLKMLIPYGVYVELEDKHHSQEKLVEIRGSVLDTNLTINYPIYKSVKPVLRKVSDLTAKEKEELHLLGAQYCVPYKSFYSPTTPSIQAHSVLDAIIWFNKHKVDYLGLIDMDQAVHADKSLYKDDEH